MDIFKVASNAIVGAKSARNDDGEGKKKKKKELTTQRFSWCWVDGLNTDLEVK